MPNNFFGAPVGTVAPKYDNLIAGSPEYTHAVVDQDAREMQPYFQSAKRANDQGMIVGGGGELPTGAGLQSGLSLKESYLNHLGETASRATIHGADLGEENRRRTEGRAWQVQDRDLARQDLRDRAQREQDAADQAMWGNLIGTAAGAVGGYFGGPIGAGLASQGSKALFDQYGNPTSYPQDQALEPPPGTGDPNGPPPIFRDTSNDYGAYAPGRTSY